MMSIIPTPTVNPPVADIICIKDPSGQLLQWNIIDGMISLPNKKGLPLVHNKKNTQKAGISTYLNRFSPSAKLSHPFNYDDDFMRTLHRAVALKTPLVFCTEGVPVQRTTPVLFAIVKLDRMQTIVTLECYIMLLHEMDELVKKMPQKKPILLDLDRTLILNKIHCLPNQLDAFVSDGSIEGVQVVRDKTGELIPFDYKIAISPYLCSFMRRVRSAGCTVFIVTAGDSNYGEAIATFLKERNFGCGRDKDKCDCPDPSIPLEDVPLSHVFSVRSEDRKSQEKRAMHVCPWLAQQHEPWYACVDDHVKAWTELDRDNVFYREPFYPQCPKPDALLDIIMQIERELEDTVVGTSCAHPIQETAADRP